MASQLENEDIGTFAAQVLTAKSWYRGKDARGAEAALLDAIDSVLGGTDPRQVRQFLNIAAQRVNQTLR